MCLMFDTCSGFFLFFYSTCSGFIRLFVSNDAESLTLADYEWDLFEATRTSNSIDTV